MLRMTCLVALVATVLVAPMRAADADAPGVVPSDIASTYLAHRPTLGDVTVIDIHAESGDRKLLAATLQGIVNRTQARIYLLGMRSVAEDQFWLDWYQSHSLIHVIATVDLDTALSTFASEVAGYVIADDAEPWTINTATTAAGVLGGVVVTPATVGAAQAAGLTELDDHRGRWPDAATAYEAAATAYRSSLGEQAVAIQSPGSHQPRDLFVQQGMFVLYTRPPRSDFDRVYDLIDTFPTDHPVYGYISDTGDEEVVAILRLSKAGRFLVPTDSTDNLSFHLAVGGAARAQAPAVDTDVAPCTSDQVNVVLSVGDGDNMVVPESYYLQAGDWLSRRRGDLPFGWGINVSTAVLMPAVWDQYATTATPNDELVTMMGLGYSLPSQWPDGVGYLKQSLRMQSALGLRARWSLDAFLSRPDDPGWDAWASAIDQTGSGPSGFLLDYLDFGGPAQFYERTGRPVLSAKSRAYGESVAQITQEVQDLMATPAAQRSLVTFIPVTVWSASYQDVADALVPLEGQGVRFLTPSQAFACLPPAPPPPPTTTTTAVGGGSTGPSTPATPAEAVAGQPSYTG